MSVSPALRALALEHGVEPSYVDVRGEEQDADPEALRAVLALLGPEVRSDADAEDAVRAAHVQRWRTVVDPVTVAWDGAATVVVRADVAEGPPAVSVTLEDGSEVALPVPDAPGDGAEVEGRTVGRWEVAVDQLPAGVHHVVTDRGAGTLLSAPSTTWRLEGRDHRWGVFAPLYALRDGRDRPLGDLTTLGRFATWAGDRGADWVATLPLLPGFYDDPIEVSPYRPVSRLAWNELYLDPELLPELDPAEDTVRDGGADTVDWAGVARDVHGLLGRAIDRLSDRRRDELEAFLAAHPDVAGYARFRGGGRPAVELLHAYAQWCLHDQIDDLAARLAAHDQALYLDLPLGVHPDGYDAAVHADAFAAGATVGAPPDDFFSYGQDWGFAPLHPERGRAGGHPYLRACLDHHLGPAGMLRIDHVMGLHRLWWVPTGFPASTGVYVRYPAEELYAAVCLASHRHGAEIVGENLGTVPPDVDEALAAHGLVGMWPVQLAVPAGDDGPPPGSLAVVDTHDMAPFAAFWAEGGEPRKAVADLLDVPEDDPEAAHAALLAWLGAGPARHVQVAFEDLWLEPRPQNRPGTGAEAGNWTRRVERTLAEVAADPAIEAAVDGLEAARRTATTLTEDGPAASRRPRSPDDQGAPPE